MGRKNQRPAGRRPQHSRASANQELRRAVQAGRPEPFGIRRYLAHEDDADIRDTFYDYLIDNEYLARLMQPRTRLHLTIMRKRELDSQLARGLVVGYEYGRASARIQHEIKESHPFLIQVTYKEPRIMKRGRALVLAVEGEDMMDEVRSTMRAMASIGLRGALRNDGFKPHITLAEAATPLSSVDKRELLSEVGELWKPGHVINLNPLEFYPPRRD